MKSSHDKAFDSRIITSQLGIFNKGIITLTILVLLISLTEMLTGFEILKLDTFTSIIIIFFVYGIGYHLGAAFNYKVIGKIFLTSDKIEISYRGEPVKIKLDDTVRVNIFIDGYAGRIGQAYRNGDKNWMEIKEKDKPSERFNFIIESQRHLNQLNELTSEWVNSNRNFISSGLTAK